MPASSLTLAMLWLTAVCNKRMARSQDIILMIFLSSAYGTTIRLPFLKPSFQLNQEATGSNTSKQKGNFRYKKPRGLERAINSLIQYRFLLTPQKKTPTRFAFDLMARADGMTEGVEMAGEIKKQKQKKNKMNVESNLGFNPGSKHILIFDAFIDMHIFVKIQWNLLKNMPFAQRLHFFFFFSLSLLDSLTILLSSVYFLHMKMCLCIIHVEMCFGASVSLEYPIRCLHVDRYTKYKKGADSDRKLDFA